jgi:polysaccharide export outer membrane protein
VELFKSPAYYLKQNDVVYVEPNRAKADQSTTNENTMKSTSLWVSVGSFLVTIATLIINVIPK